MAYTVENNKRKPIKEGFSVKKPSKKWEIALIVLLVVALAILGLYLYRRSSNDSTPVPTMGRARVGFRFY
jgi:uncharacterized membrane protein